MTVLWSEFAWRSLVWRGLSVGDAPLMARDGDICVDDGQGDVVCGRSRS